MKMYYKLTASVAMPHDMKTQFIHSFNLMEVKSGRKWVTFYGMSDDIVTACDLINENGFAAKKTWYKNAKL